MLEVTGRHCLDQAVAVLLGSQEGRSSALSSGLGDRGRPCVCAGPPRAVGGQSCCCPLFRTTSLTTPACICSESIGAWMAKGAGMVRMARGVRSADLGYSFGQATLLLAPPLPRSWHRRHDRLFSRPEGSLERGWEHCWLQRPCKEITTALRYHCAFKPRRELSTLSPLRNGHLPRWTLCGERHLASESASPHEVRQLCTQTEGENRRSGTAAVAELQEGSYLRNAAARGSCDCRISYNVCGRVHLACSFTRACRVVAPALWRLALAAESFCEL